eukprot:gb/GEZN01042091.1/.p1 GENE.gb/GEZN01042091.1/~~gb/GEZN01042091.1/.p1  ORF type:complete len:104 (-),score=3.09 gb/GEZN01042091.1/:4-315(-)
MGNTPEMTHDEITMGDFYRANLPISWSDLKTQYHPCLQNLPKRQTQTPTQTRYRHSNTNNYLRRKHGREEGTLTQALMTSLPSSSDMSGLYILSKVLPRKLVI